ncbi:DnaJ domain-containing protein [Variovorax sp. J22R24]|uniref:J domain-containing protein n=1 Tax=Variovorax gracilis TaxID=3053502 RepID=UPI002578D95A|nr:DnaJ domain-containing protein [Variovorax sp. J22R24]MDM0109893.1 DnaJ domain-containing protein [Variovorax sp. J22R24]
MSGTEIGAVLVGLLVGYWIIDALISKMRAGREGSNASSPTHADEPPALPQFVVLKEGALRPWHEVLSVDKTASSEEIRAAYVALIEQYHPGKVASMGQEIKLVAERKTNEITAAYRAGMRARL